MNKKIHSRDAYDISEEEYHKLRMQPGAQMVVDAVRHYNELVSHSEFFENKDGNTLQLKEVEEKDAQAFLDGVFDITQKRG
jgi:hypothetical protein